MAKRFTISLPDDLARRIEPFKDQLSLSAIMQKSLEAELAELLRPEGEKTKAAALLDRAKSFYKDDFAVLVKGANAFVDHIIDNAIHDADLYVFRLYNDLHSKSDSEIQKDSSEDSLFNRLVGFDQDRREKIDECEDWQEALELSFFTDQKEIDQKFPGKRPWDDSDWYRVIKMVLDEKLRSLLGDEAIRTYLKWGSGYANPSAVSQADSPANEDSSSS
ncbi:MAG: hypothetical protein VKM34_05700 [Cyanobacteriota bacterium]|nr:hypothetical protein [Cyanobacteriota bacterium]